MCVIYIILESISLLICITLCRKFRHRRRPNLYEKIQIINQYHRALVRIYDYKKKIRITQVQQSVCERYDAHRTCLCRINNDTNCYQKQGVLNEKNMVKK